MSNNASLIARDTINQRFTFGFMHGNSFILFADFVSLVPFVPVSLVHYRKFRVCQYPCAVVNCPEQITLLAAILVTRYTGTSRPAVVAVKFAEFLYLLAYSTPALAL